MPLAADAMFCSSQRVHYSRAVKYASVFAVRDVFSGTLNPTQSNPISLSHAPVTTTSEYEFLNFSELCSLNTQLSRCPMTLKVTGATFLCGRMPFLWRQPDVYRSFQPQSDT